MAMVSSWIEDEEPELVVSDVSVEITLLARLHGVRVVSVVLPGDRSDPAHVLGYRVSDALVAAWPPGTQAMVSGPLRDVAERLTCVGGLSRFDVFTAGPRTEGPARVTVLAGAGGTAATPALVASAKRETRAGAGTCWLRRPSVPGATTRRDCWRSRTSSSPTPDRTRLPRSRRRADRPWWCRRTHPTASRQRPRASCRTAAGRPLCAVVADVRVAGAAGGGVEARRYVVERVVRRRRCSPVRRGHRADEAARCRRESGRMSVAVVTLAHARHEHLARQARSLLAGTRTPDQYVVVGMDDSDIAPYLHANGTRATVVEVSSREQGLPLARARNVGVRRALDGGATVVVLRRRLPRRPGPPRGYATAVARPSGHDLVRPGDLPGSAPRPGGYDLARSLRPGRPASGRPPRRPGCSPHGADPDLFWSLSFAVTGATWARRRLLRGLCRLRRRGHRLRAAWPGRPACDLLAGSAPPRLPPVPPGLRGPRSSTCASILANAAVFHRRWGAGRCVAGSRTSSAWGSSYGRTRDGNLLLSSIASPWAGVRDSGPPGSDDVGGQASIGGAVGRRGADLDPARLGALGDGHAQAQHAGVEQ